MGQHPPEVDSPADIKSGSVPGVKHAAVRKLKQELGICPDQLPMEDFRYGTLLLAPLMYFVMCNPSLQSLVIVRGFSPLPHPLG